MDVKRKWKEVTVSRFSLPYIPFWCWLVLLLDGFIGDVRLDEYLILVWFHLQCSTTLDQGNVDLRACLKNHKYFQQVSVISRHPWFWTLLGWSFCLLVSSWWIKTWWHTQHVWPAAFVAKGYVVVFPITFCVILIISLGNYGNNATGTCRSHIDLKETCLTFAEKRFEQKIEEYFVNLNHLSHNSVWLWVFPEDRIKRPLLRSHPWRRNARLLPGSKDQGVKDRIVTHPRCDRRGCPLGFGDVSKFGNLKIG